MLEQHPKRAEVILIVYLALLVLGQLLRWQVSLTTAIYPVDLLSIVLLPAAFTVLPSHWWCWWKSHIRFTKWLMILLACWILLGWLLAWNQHQEILGSILRFARVGGQLVVGWYLTYHVRPRAASWWISVLWLLGITWGWLQYLAIPDMRWLAVFGWDDHYYRMMGAFFDPNYLGVWCVMALVWFWRFELSRKWLGISTLMITAAIAVTFSRASYLALAVSTVWMLLWHHTTDRKYQQWWLTGLVAGTLVVSILLAPKPGGEGVNLGRTASSSARLTASVEWMPHTWQEWLIGRGVGIHSVERSESYRADHSQLPDTLALLVLSGVGIGGSFLVVCLVWLLRKEWMNWPTWLQAMWLAVLVHAQFNNTLFQPMIWSWLMIVTFFGRTNRTWPCARLTSQAKTNH